MVNDDKKWFALIHGLFQHFKYRNILTEELVAYFNRKTGMNLTPIFNQYLRHTAIPVLELQFDEAQGTVSYRGKWRAGLRHAGARGRQRPLANRPSVRGMENPEDPAQEG